MWKWLTMVLVVVAVLVPAAQAGRDITGPGDAVQGVPNDGISTNDDHGWPGNEPPKQAFDDRIDTKYLHFKGEDEPTGVRVTPKVGETVVTGVTFTTANDSEVRDPVKWELSGSNESIDGPYTLIASGDIVDFAGATAWGRRTKTTTPMLFANTVAYKHYQVMFPAIRDPAGSTCMQVAEIELLMDVLKATAPDPANGGVVTLPLFRWTKGDTAVVQDVYFGTSPDLTAADLKVSHGSALQTMYYHVMPPLEPGVTYYWRVDQIDAAGNVYTGDVWSVLAAPKKAYDPRPRDGDKWQSVASQLNWSAGVGATSHEVYFGTDQAAVAARAAGVSKGSTLAPTYDPGALQENTTYYWAVDEIISGTKYAGPVWSFSTLGGSGGIRGDYFVGTTPGGMPAMSRVDQEVNINLLGTESPGGSIPGDAWSARWTADLDIPVADTYTFAVNCQDGTRLWIDGELIIDQWITPTVTSKYYTVPMAMTAGIHSLRLEYFDSGGDAVEQLYWSTPTMAEMIIPAGPLQPPLRARASYPSDGALDVPQEPVLVWGAGDKAAKHDVYFGDDRDAVANATPATADVYRGQQALDETTFDPGTLEWNKTYYWRVDEVNDAETGSPWKSGVWAFTTADFLVVDDMETYTDDEGSRIYEFWIDGYADESSGSTVGYMEAPFAEQSIVHSGRQSMPFAFDNSKTPYYSEAKREFSPAQNWTINDVNTLTLFVRGYPSMSTVAVAETGGKINLTGAGADIWGNSDEFTYAYKTLTGDGSMTARVVSNGTGTNTWAKGGVMIRDSLNGGSSHASMTITGSGGNGASFQYRAATDGASANVDSGSVVAPPYWVKMERMGDTLTGSISSDGTFWVTINTTIITMEAPVYVGLCVTSHVAGADRTYQFDSITTSGAVSGAWQGAVINAPVHNSGQKLYLTVEDSAGKKATATHDTAVTTGAWTEIKFPLSDFAGVSMTKVEKLIVGVGDPASPAADGTGSIFVDDIRVTK